MKKQERDYKKWDKVSRILKSSHCKSMYRSLLYFHRTEKDPNVKSDQLNLTSKNDDNTNVYLKEINKCNSGKLKPIVIHYAIKSIILLRSGRLISADIPAKLVGLGVQYVTDIPFYLSKEEHSSLFSVLINKLRKLQYIISRVCLDPDELSARGYNITKVYQKSKCTKDVINLLEVLKDIADNHVLKNKKRGRVGLNYAYLDLMLYLMHYGDLSPTEAIKLICKLALLYYDDGKTYTEHDMRSKIDKAADRILITYNTSKNDS